MNDNMILKIRIIDIIKKNEGFESRLYKDIKGKLTIGYGFNLEEIQIPENIAYMWLKMLVDDLYLNLSTLLDFFDFLDEVRKAVLVDMAYNIGVEGLLKFKKMLKALENKNYEKTAEEMKNSKWYEEVPNRADKLIKMMITGEFDVS